MNYEGQIFDDRYRISHFLGQGGMAAVYVARDLQTSSDVAVKILPPGDETKNEFVLRFQREFKVCSQLDHTNIVKLYSCGQTPDRESWYYAMELFNAKDLEEVIEENGTLSEKDTLRIAVSLAKAFEYYHPKGITHRDLKPANIMVERTGRIVIMDFGLVHDPTRTKLTRSGVMVGTPLYMSPELLRGDKPDHRSDIFQLGSIVHECLTGVPAFIGKNLQEVGSKILFGKYEPLQTINPQVSQDWENFVRNCLQVKLEDRYQSAQEILSDLKLLARGKEVKLHHPPETTTAQKGGDAPIGDAGLQITEKEEKSPSRQHRPRPKTEMNHTPVESPAPKKKSLKLIPAFFIIALILSIGLVIQRRPKEQAVSTRTIHDVSFITGKTSAIIQWSSSEPIENVTIKCSRVVASGPPVSQQDLLYSSVKHRQNPDRKLTVHYMHIKGLKEDSKYQLTIKPQGERSESLPRQFSTKRSSASPVIGLQTDGSLTISLQSDVPFFLNNVSSNLRFEGTYAAQWPRSYSSGTIQLPFSEIMRNSSVTYELETIDGEKFRSQDSASQILTDALDTVFLQFMKSREISTVNGHTFVPFFSTWTKAGKENFIFQTYSLLYLKEQTPQGKAAVLKRFWEEVEAKLKTDFQWYRLLQPLFPGLKKLIDAQALPWEIRDKLAMALIGIELIQGSSVSYRIADNPGWAEFVSNDSRPFTFYEKSSLGKEAEEHAGVISLERLRSENLPILVSHDMCYPPNHDKLSSSVLAPFIGGHELRFPDSIVPSKYKKAEIALDFRSTGNPSMVILLSINNGKFVATLRPTREYFVRFHESWHPQNDFDTILVRSYTENKLVDLAKVIEGSSSDLEKTFERYRETMLSMDQTLPHVRGISLYHPIPVEALNPGENKVNISVLNGPSAGPKPLVYKSLRLLLAK